MSIIGYENLLKTKGIHLDCLGLSDIALERDDAIAAVSMLEGEMVPILGGDVYFVCDKKIDIAYANWHIRKRPGEGFGDLCQRSLKETMEYIKFFPKSSGRNPIFLLVLKHLDT